MTFDLQTIYAEARLLMSDEGENPEYDRALIELIMRLTCDDFSVVAAKLKEAT